MTRLGKIVGSARNARLVLALLGAAFVPPGHVAAQQPRVGQAPATLTIEGIVTSVRVSKAGVTFLNFGGSYPHQTFAAIIFRSGASLFPNPQQWEGKMVRVTGVLQEYEKRPAMVLKAPSQLTLASRESQVSKDAARGVDHATAPRPRTRAVRITRG